MASALRVGRDADGSDAAFAMRSGVADDPNEGGWHLMGEGSHHPDGRVAHGMLGGMGGHHHGKRQELRPSARAAAQFAAVRD